MRRFFAGLSAAAFAFGGLVAIAVAAHPAIADTTTPSLTVGDVSVWEGNSGSLTVKVPVDLSVTPSSPVTAFYAITADGASKGDFTARTGKLVFQANRTPSKAVSAQETP